MQECPLPVHVNTATPLAVISVGYVVTIRELDSRIVTGGLIWFNAGATHVLVQKSGNGERIVTNKFGIETTWIL